MNDQEKVNEFKRRLATWPEEVIVFIPVDISGMNDIEYFQRSLMKGLGLPYEGK